MRRTRARPGMTLMELIVTLTITGLMTTAGAAAFSSIIDHRRVVVQANVQTERAAALRDMIRTWITSGTVQIQSGGRPGAAGTNSSRVVVRATPNAPVGVTPAVASGDEVTFTTSALTPANTPSTRIRLYIDLDDTTPEYGLSMEYQGSTNLPLQRRQIAPDIGAMVVEYLDSRTHQWFAASQAATIQPMALRLTFGSVDSTNSAYALPSLLTMPFVFRIGNPQTTTGPR